MVWQQFQLFLQNKVTKSSSNKLRSLVKGLNEIGISFDFIDINDL